MEIVYARGQVTAQDVQDGLEDGPSYSAVRAALSLLEKRGLLSHSRTGTKYLFAPTVPATSARVSALKRMLETFFENSAESIVATLLGSKELQVSDEELNRLEKLIKEARKGRAA